MKILFFVHSLSSGGAERVIATLANHWAGKDWEVSIVTIADADRDFYTLDAGVRRIALELAVDSRHPGQAVVNNLRRIQALRGILLREKPDVAVGMMATGSAILACAALGSGVPAIGSERIHPPALPLGRSWEALRRWSYPKLTALVAQTGQSAEWLRANAPAPYIQVIPNPVNFPMAVQVPRLVPAQTLGIFKYPRMVLSVGRLEQQKGFDRLLRAYAWLAHGHPGWMLAILGEGKLRHELKHEAERLGIDDRVCMPGVVGNVGEWFEAAELYALTSRFEGFPNTLLEAMAHGLPTVAVDCETGPREIIRHEVDGLLVPQDDEDALVGALDRMMGSKGLRAQFGKRAVEVRERFAVERIATEWEALFRTLGTHSTISARD